MNWTDERATRDGKDRKGTTQTMRSNIRQALIVLQSRAQTRFFQSPMTETLAKVLESPCERKEIAGAETRTISSHLLSSQTEQDVEDTKVRAAGVDTPEGYRPPNGVYPSIVTGRRGPNISEADLVIGLKLY